MPTKKPVPWNKGIKRPSFSKEWREKMSQSHRGKPSGMLGKKHTLETIKKIKKWRPNKEQLKRMKHIGQDNYLWLGDDVIVSCKICNKKIKCRPNKKKTYCSYKCLGKSKRKSKNKCKDCGKVLPRKESVRCQECDGKFRSGNKSPSWKGGISPVNTRIRQSQKFKKWRKAVFERDDYTCLICGDRGGELHPHHIYEFSKYLELRFDIENGATLCVYCHKEIHKY